MNTYSILKRLTPFKTPFLDDLEVFDLLFKKKEDNEPETKNELTAITKFEKSLAI